MSIQVSEHRTLLHRVILPGEVPQQGPAAAVSNHIKGAPGSLSVWRRQSHLMPDLLITGRPGAKIFFLTVDIDGQG